MRHDWIIDVLRNMKDYAHMNGLPALALKVEEALRTAEAEIAASDSGAGGSGPDQRRH